MLLAWPGGGPVKIAVAAGLAAILARSLAKLNQERRRAAGDVRGAALMDIAQTLGGFAIGAGLIALGLRGAAPVAGMGAAAAVVLIFVLPAELKRGAGGAFERGQGAGLRGLRRAGGAVADPGAGAGHHRPLPARRLTWATRRSASITPATASRTAPWT